MCAQSAELTVTEKRNFCYYQAETNQARASKRKPHCDQTVSQVQVHGVDNYMVDSDDGRCVPDARSLNWTITSIAQ